MIKAIKHSWLTVIMLIVVCMALSIGYTELFTEDQYKSAYIMKSSIPVSQIKKVIENDNLRESVDNQTGQAKGTTRKAITLSKENGQIVISAVTNDAILSKKIVDGVVSELITQYPTQIIITKRAVVAQEEENKHLPFNTLIGFLIGLGLGVIDLVITYLFNRDKKKDSGKKKGMN